MARRRKVTLEQLGPAIADIVSKYGQDMEEGIDLVTRKVGNEGAKQLRSASSIFGGTGKYASGWTSKLETDRHGTKAVIHNAKVPGLPHLLEHGHAKRGGGRVEGRTHIAPVEEELVRQYGEQVMRVIQ